MDEGESFSFLPLLDVMMNGVGILSFVSCCLLLSPPPGSQAEPPATRLRMDGKPPGLNANFLECRKGSVSVPGEGLEFGDSYSRLREHLRRLAERNREHKAAGLGRRECVVLLVRPSCASDPEGAYERVTGILSSLPLIYTSQPLLENERIGIEGQATQL